MITAKVPFFSLKDHTPKVSAGCYVVAFLNRTVTLCSIRV